MYFSINKPLAGHDEDAPAYADNSVLIVCDGLAGSGQNSYNIDGEIRTSAYLGSRKVAEVCREFCMRYYDELFRDLNNTGDVIASLKEEINSSLNDYVVRNELVNRVKGKSMEMLPTTLAAIVYRSFEDHTEALVISAGDSRAFVLTPENGLQQISRDDTLEEVDAFEKSSTMTNNISQDGEYYINYFLYNNLPACCMLMVCTDGFFDYISTPMEMEFRIEYSIMKGENFFKNQENRFCDLLCNSLIGRSGQQDDCSLAGAIVGYSDSDIIRKIFYERAKYVKEKYIDKSPELKKEIAKQRAEINRQLTNVEKQVTEYNIAIEDTIKKAITEAFRKKYASKNDERLSLEEQELLALMEEHETYRDFLVELNHADAEKRKANAEQTEEYSVIRRRMQKSFEESMHFEGFIKQIQNQNPMLFDKGWSIYNKSIKLQNNANAAVNSFIENLNIFADYFKTIIDMNTEQKVERFSELIPLYDNLQSSYYGLIRIKKQLIINKEELNKYYKVKYPMVDAEFTKAWKSEFAEYTRCSQYESLHNDYDQCVALLEQLNSFSISLAKENIDKFNTFFTEHAKELLERLSVRPKLLQRTCGSVWDEYLSLEKKRNDLRKSASECNEKKYALWREYKPGYELYEQCSLKGKA